MEEAETLEISNYRLMVLLTDLLISSAGDQYSDDANGSRSGNVSGIVNLPKTLKHLLCT